VLNWLLLNLLIAFVLPNFFTLYGGLIDSLLAFAAGLVALTLADRSYGRYLWRSALFVIYLAWQIVLSNFAIAGLILQPKPKLDPGIIAIPLSVSTDLEIMALASAITLTPGTISVDLGRVAKGRRVLYVHALVVEDPDKVRAGIKATFERRIIRISAGRSAP
jgi:multicomponent Na+:H+ antiporter subunit E